MTRQYPNTGKSALIVALIYLVVLMCSSCSSDFYCSKCPTKDSTVINVVEKIDWIPKDSIIRIPRDSFIIHFKDSVPCKDFEAQGEDQKGNKIKIRVKNHKASAQCECSEYKARIQWMEKHYTKLITTDRTLTRFVPSKKKCNFWLPFILGNLTMLIVWQRKRILGLILKVVKPVG